MKPQARIARLAPVTLVLVAALAALNGFAAQTLAATDTSESDRQRLVKLETEVTRGEDLRAIKKLQRAYGYYLDKGLWEDLADLFADDAIANYPAGIYIGKPSIRTHLYKNVGSGDIGLAEGRLYNHMNLQPVIHLDPDGQSAKGRWRAFAMMGGYGRNANWAEGIYEIGYVKQNGVWKIRTLDYHSGFGASYEGGWARKRETGAGGGGRPAGRPPLAHPADRPRNEPCAGYPSAACVAPFHYRNVASGEAPAWHAASADAKPGKSARLKDLAYRVTLLQDEQEIENLQRIYGYYIDRAMWDEAAGLFADDGTIELDMRGVYVGRQRVRQFLELSGPQGLREGQLNDHIQLQPIVDVAADGRSAWGRSRELGMTGVLGGTGTWSEGIYQNTYVKEDGVWKIKTLRFYSTFISDYDKGWGKDAQPVPTASSQLPPDRPPSETYEIYPKPHVPAFHYNNPVTGKPPRYPAIGAPSKTIQSQMKTAAKRSSARSSRSFDDDGITVASVEAGIQRVKAYHELENLGNAYGYYLDKNLWNEIADLFATDGSMELAQRGVYVGRERVRNFLLTVFGKEGPVAGRLGNHIQLQPVIHVAPDGNTANIRIRLLQQMGSYGERGSWGGAIYENTAVKEHGVWKLQSVHAYNTFTAGYEGGWTKSPGRGVPGPSKTLPPDRPPTLVFEMFPKVYSIPFHYENPVTKKTRSAASSPRDASR